MGSISNARRKHEFDPGLSGLWLNRLYLIRRVIAEGIKRNAHQLTGKLLDYGCGSKPYEELFPATEYIGIDVEVSGHPTDRKTADVYFDGVCLPFSDSEFDSVLVSEVVEHLFDLPCALVEISRVMKPSGKLLITCPFVWPLHEEPYDYARYTPFALSHELERAGFRIIEQDRGGMPVEVLGQMLLTEIIGGRFLSVPKLSLVVEMLANGFVNCICRALAKLSEPSTKFYLSNILLAEKVVSVPVKIASNR